MKTCSDCSHFAEPDYCVKTRRDVRAKLPKCRNFKEDVIKLAKSKSWNK